MRSIRVGLVSVALAALGLAAAPSFAQTQGNVTFTCDRACLTRVVDAYIAGLIANNPALVPFAQGAKLSKADPSQLLQGRAGVRYVVIASLADFNRAEIEALMAAALKLAKLRPKAGAKGAVVIRAEAQKKRAQRAKKA